MHVRAAVLVALSLAACEAAQTEPEAIEVIGPLAYEVAGGFCTDGCPRERIYRSHDDQLQLLVTHEGERELEVMATLAPELAAQLDMIEDELAAGTHELGTIDASCPYVEDRPLATLYVAGVSVTYVVACPPSGLVELDGHYAALRQSMTSCASSPLLLDCTITFP